MTNNLYLETLVILNVGGSMMEHPAPPKVEEYVSVRRLRLQQLVSMALHNACQVLIQQWRYGCRRQTNHHQMHQPGTTHGA